MKIIRHILRLLLVLLIFFYSLPQFCLEDVDQNNQIELADAIQQVRGMLWVGDQPDGSTLASGLGRAISTLKVLAAIKPNIKSPRDIQNSFTEFSPGAPFLISENFTFASYRGVVKISSLIISFKSISHAPDPPHPRFS